ncbi:MAG TPA: restriction endonuclease [Roseiarcus sp.]|nr:restriction endonuclease [Roseiarcus sp.]
MSGEDRSKPTDRESLRAGEVTPAPLPPNERIIAAAKELGTALRDDLLNRIFAIEPMSARARFFERLVIRLLLSMGYGRDRDEWAFHTGGRGDGGVDGVIHEDALGTNPVYVQAKCYERGAVIGPKEIQASRVPWRTKAQLVESSSQRRSSVMLRGIQAGRAKSRSHWSMARSWLTSWPDLTSARRFSKPSL